MKKQGFKKEELRNLAMVSQLGIMVISPIVLCVALGVWLDGRFGTWFTLPLLVLGVISGGKLGYDMAMKCNKEDTDEAKQREKEQRLLNEALESWNHGNDSDRQ